jgi:hypothetical protein
MRPFGTVMRFGHDLPLAAHRRIRVAKQQGKNFVACTDPSDASGVHENDLVDQ